jgi:hypothetical protein
MTIKTASISIALVATAVLLAPSSASAQRGGADRAPSGSYERSCNNISVSGGRLYATCRDVGRNQRPSSLNLSRCSGSDIGNDNGLLVCAGTRGDWERETGGGRPDGGRPGNGWGAASRGSITVYKDANFNGERATFRGEVYNLASTGLNDAISSMEMRGAWEACTDSNFRGQCQIFEGDVRNLSRWGFNDRISSLRPVRGRGY